MIWRFDNFPITLVKWCKAAFEVEYAYVSKDGTRILSTDPILITLAGSSGNAAFSSNGKHACVKLEILLTFKFSQMIHRNKKQKHAAFLRVFQSRWPISLKCCKSAGTITTILICVWLRTQMSRWVQVSIVPRIFWYIELLLENCCIYWYLASSKENPLWNVLLLVSLKDNKWHQIFSYHL